MISLDLYQISPSTLFNYTGFLTALDTLYASAHGANEPSKMGKYLLTGIVLMTILSLPLGIAMCNATNVSEDLFLLDGCHLCRSNLTHILFHRRFSYTLSNLYLWRLKRENSPCTCSQAYLFCIRMNY